MVAADLAGGAALPDAERRAALGEALRGVRSKIAQAALRVGRDPGCVRLVGVTKGTAVADAALAVAAGLADLAESRVQEALPKLAVLPEARWHWIGRLQRNKAAAVVGRFALVHSVDRLGLAERLEAAAERLGCVQPLLLQVDLAGRPGQGGVPAGDAHALLLQMRGLPHLRVRGLMTIAPPAEHPEEVRPVFAALRGLRDRLQEAAGCALPELSMGMSADYPVAIEEGATLVRVGRAIFGQAAHPGASLRDAP